MKIASIKEKPGTWFGLGFLILVLIWAMFILPNKLKDEMLYQTFEPISIEESLETYEGDKIKFAGTVGNCNGSWMDVKDEDGNVMWVDVKGQGGKIDEYVWPGDQILVRGVVDDDGWLDLVSFEVVYSPHSLEETLSY